jgi:hypothetical protein
VLHLDTPMLFALGFLTMFVLGGISGVMLAMVPLDIYVSDTYFIVAHIHYVLFGGSLFTIYAGVYYWFPKMTGRMFDDTLGKLHFWLTFIFFNCTFAPMHLIGVEGMPRRVADYPEQFAGWNLFISLSSFVLGLSTLVFVYNIVASWRGGPAGGGQPLACAHARVAGLLAAADLQLRQRAHGRRRPVRVRRAQRRPRDLPAGRPGRRDHPRRWPPRAAVRRRPGRPDRVQLPRARERDDRRRQAARPDPRAGQGRERAISRGGAADAPAPRQRDLRRGGARRRPGPG